MRQRSAISFRRRRHCHNILRRVESEALDDVHTAGSVLQRDLVLIRLRLNYKLGAGKTDIERWITGCDREWKTHFLACVRIDEFCGLALRIVILLVGQTEAFEHTADV